MFGNVKLEGHEHRVSLITSHDEGFECDACDRSYRGGYSCGECKFAIHKKCAFVFDINEISNHPCHEGHCLKLVTTGAPDHTDPTCHLCGKNTKRLLYHCSDCKLNLDIDCVFNALCSQADQNMPWHPHPLLMLNFTSEMWCEICGLRGDYGYLCLVCRLVVHESCSGMDSLEITHPCHVRHPLKLMTNGAPEYTDGSCHLCGVYAWNILYHCDICKFNLDLPCCFRRGSPEVSLSNTKVHEEHTLTLMPKLISFVCDACGTKGDRAPYVCVQCDFMTFHQKCARLPRVIHVNHHDHRVSYKYPLGLGEWRCGVCWEDIDWSYGAYTCSLCPKYAIHSNCATRDDVWDGKELDGVPEDIEDIEPFKRSDDNTITHFAHVQHNLMSLSKEDGDESSFCVGCACPIGSYAFYKCSESDCSFILHETCAHLSKKKRHFLSREPLALSLKSSGYQEYCRACHLVFLDGFIYFSSPWHFDLLCSSITMPFMHASHDHHLLYHKIPIFTNDAKTCQGCGVDEKEMVVGCKKCDYYLDFRCATLPVTVTLPRYDDHPLTLCYGDEKAQGKYWCDICERETDPKKWFYTCKDCGVTLHVFCVVGDIRYPQPGAKIDGVFELQPNNTSSRPRCHICHCRCPGSFTVKHINNGQSFCSYYCLSGYEYYYGRTGNLRCPPWY